MNPPRQSLNPPLARLLAAGCLVAAIAACSSVSPLTSPSGGEYPLPIADFSGPNGQPLLCAGTAFGGSLHGSANDPRHVWITRDNGSRAEVAWPAGYRARFDPGLELLDASDQVIGREGSMIEGGCPTSDPHVLLVELAPIGSEVFRVM